MSQSDERGGNILPNEGGPIKPTIKCKCCPDCVIRLGFDFTQPDALIYSLITN